MSQRRRQAEKHFIDVQDWIKSFNIILDGNYLLTGSVRAPNERSTSFYIDIIRACNNESDWDLFTSVFQNQNVSLRGHLGNFTYSQFNLIFYLTKGAHILYIKQGIQGEIKNI